MERELGPDPYFVSDASREAVFVKAMADSLARNSVMETGSDDYQSASDHIDYKRQLSPALADADIENTLKRDLLFNQIDTETADLYRGVTTEHAVEISSDANEQIQAIRAEAGPMIDELIRQKQIELSQPAAGSVDGERSPSVAAAIRSGLDAVFGGNTLLDVDMSVRADAYREVMGLIINKICLILFDSQVELDKKVRNDERVINAFSGQNEPVLSNLSELAMDGAKLECEFTRLAIIDATNGMLNQYGH